MKKVTLLCLLLLCLTSCSRNREISRKEREADLRANIGSYIQIKSNPEIIEQPKLTYPDKAKSAGVEGKVIIEAEVLKTGNVGMVKVDKSVMPGKGGLDEAAMDYVKKLKFKPAIQNGNMIDSRVKIPVQFTIENPNIKSTQRFIYHEEPPAQINRVKLEYPELCKNAGVEGTVMLEIKVLESGKVGEVKIIKSVYPGKGGLDEAAINYVKQLEFKPAMQNGMPIAVWIKYPITFYVN